MNKKKLITWILCGVLAIGATGGAIAGLIVATHKHKYSEDWTYDTTHHWHVSTCSHKDQISDYAEHVWDEGVVTEPTYTSEGYTTYTCEICSAQKQVEKTDKLVEDVVPKDYVIEKDGVQYLHKVSGDVILTKATTNFTSETFSIPSGVTRIEDEAFLNNATLKNLTLPATVKTIGRAFENSSLETIALNEGLETISESAFKNSKLTSVSVPSSVQSIGSNAFSNCTDLQSIAISGMETVISESVAVACANLTSVEIKGANVRFEGTNMLFAKDENGDALGINISLANIKVGEKFEVASAGSTGYGLSYSMNETSENSGVYTDGELYCTYTQAGFVTALSNGWDIILGDGTYSMVNTTADVEISGTPNALININSVMNLSNYDLIFNGLSIKGGDNKAINGKTTIFNNCIIEGDFYLFSDGTTFNGCTFEIPSGKYIWTNGYDVVFDECTFNTAGKAILIYSHGSTMTSDVTVTNCVFNASAEGFAGDIANQCCAAIELNNFGCGINLTTANNTVGNNFSGEWRIKKYVVGNPSITVNGKEYTTIAVDGKIMTIDSDKNVTIVD